MVAAHPGGIPYAAGHGMQTAFIMRPDEFGGITKPRDPEPGKSCFDATDISPEGDWIYITDSFIDLVEQIRRS